MGRSRLPPESIRWCASLGISSTSDTALSRMMRLTACMSSATIPSRGFRPSAGSRASSNGTTTPKVCYPHLEFGRSGIAGRDKGQSSPLACDRGRRPRFGPILGRSGAMRELLRSNDAVLIDFAQSVLRQAGIASFVADQYMSVVEGSIGAFPRRLQVGAEDWARAYETL